MSFVSDAQKFEIAICQLTAPTRYTLTFKPEEAFEIIDAVDFFQCGNKAIKEIRIEFEDGSSYEVYKELIQNNLIFYLLYCMYAWTTLKMFFQHFSKIHDWN